MSAAFDLSVPLVHGKRRAFCEACDVYYPRDTFHDCAVIRAIRAKLDRERRERIAERNRRHEEFLAAIRAQREEFLVSCPLAQMYRWQPDLKRMPPLEVAA